MAALPPVTLSPWAGMEREPPSTDYVVVTDADEMLRLDMARAEWVIRHRLSAEWCLEDVEIQLARANRRHRRYAGYDELRDEALWLLERACEDFGRDVVDPSIWQPDCFDFIYGEDAHRIDDEFLAFVKVVLAQLQAIAALLALLHPIGVAPTFGDRAGDTDDRPIPLYDAAKPPPAHAPTLRAHREVVAA
jgi:hypothetical protein